MKKKKKKMMMIWGALLEKNSFKQYLAYLPCEAIESSDPLLSVRPICLLHPFRILLGSLSSYFSPPFCQSRQQSSSILHLSCCPYSPFSTSEWAFSVERQRRSSRDGRDGGLEIEKEKVRCKDGEAESSGVRRSCKWKAPVMIWRDGRWGNRGRVRAKRQRRMAERSNVPPFSRRKGHSKHESSARVHSFS